MSRATTSRASLLIKLFIWVSSLAFLAHGQFVTDEALSFGTNNHIRLVDGKITGWNIYGEGHAPNILSDRVILTPPAPGKCRGSMWCETSIEKQQWMAEAYFRASGQERGTGNFQIWYAKDGHTAISSSSVYTVNKFEGLVLAVDQYGGHGGMLRGFLNDGTKSYKDHTEAEVDSFAFGHCVFPYRNLGEPSRIRLVNDASGFRVDLDDSPCFASTKIRLPPGYRFGVTASTAENPDSFEVNQFKISHATNPTDFVPPAQNQQRVLRRPSGSDQATASNGLPQAELEMLRHQGDLLTQNEHHIEVLIERVEAIRVSLETYVKSVEQKPNEILAKLTPLESQVAMVNRRMETVEAQVNQLRRDLEGRDYKEHLANLQQAIEGSLPDTLHRMVIGSAPRIGLIIFMVVGGQFLLFVLYAFYRKRRDSAPKKYL